MDFAPQATGRHAGILRISTELDHFLVDLEGVGEVGGIQTDTVDWSMVDHSVSHQSFALRNRPADRNDDGVRDEADIELVADGWPIPPVSGSGLRVWIFDPFIDTIGFLIPSIGLHVIATYEVECIE